ncbi:lipid carrier--UDP-N-acetylgalactosaminyltransferase [Alsobacter soli]|uniref:Lipid carrier--UDP-N-acetylgalactosaminyltransferase n=1 Tax=Alsobacter soli TaxID=2109933 RepID=A0A2T1HWQ1_9HYPH|nr:lipid carrier--UDP-N-acetylgalactosaminyltransferase [Alsobacter soli]
MLDQIHQLHPGTPYRQKTQPGVYALQDDTLESGLARPWNPAAARSRAKRLLDVVLAACALALLGPVLLVIAAAVKLDSPGPVFFRQRRHGLDYRVFRIWKFRTMVALEDGADVRQATRLDPRVTRVGALLRRVSLDELPQLLNVLAGDMSLVGPRPHALAHNRYYAALLPGYERRHAVLPGLTGWAQVNGLRGETDTLDKMRRRVEHDLAYVDCWSLALDLKILAMTVLPRAYRNAF